MAALGGAAVCSGRPLALLLGLGGEGSWERSWAVESLVSNIRVEHRLLPLLQHSLAGTHRPAVCFCKACQDLDRFAAHPLLILVEN